MSFNNWKQPRKPTCKPKYVVPRIRNKFCLTPELEAEFRRLYPVTLNIRMMELFGLSYGTMERIKRELGLEKDEAAIMKKTIKKIVKANEDNGHYASLRGKGPSEAAREATKKMRAEGFVPILVLKKKNRRKFNSICKRIGERHKEIVAEDRKRIRWGLDPKSKKHLPQICFTRSQINQRCSARTRGYIIGDKAEYSGERWNIYYDSETRRSQQFEENLIRSGFRIVEYKKDRQHIS